MIAFDCETARESLVAYISSATSITRTNGVCVITLPIPTVDNRLVDVFVEGTIGDYLLVHDGGKAVNEMILQGV